MYVYIIPIDQSIFSLLFCRSLCFKLDSTASLHHLLTYWLHETYWSYAARMTSIVDKERHMECVYNAIKKYFSDHSSVSYMTCIHTHTHTCTCTCTCKCIKQL